MTRLTALLVGTVGESATADRTQIGLSISNYSNPPTVDVGMEETLRRGNMIFGRHYAGDFNGHVWFADGQFHEQVWQYHVAGEIVSAPSLDELIRSVNDIYGWD